MTKPYVNLSIQSIGVDQYNPSEFWTIRAPLSIIWGMLTTIHTYLASSLHISVDLLVLNKWISVFNHRIGARFLEIIWMMSSGTQRIAASIGLVPNRRQKISWSEADLDIRCLLATLGHNKFTYIHIHVNNISMQLINKQSWPSMLWDSFQMRQILSCACAGNTGNIFRDTDFKGNRLLATPAYITARASRRDACCDH